MAYVLNPDDEQQKQQGQTSSLLAGFGAAPAPAAGAAPGPAAAPAAGPQQPSSGFVPYSAYAGANAGGAKKMAGEVAGRVGGAAESAQQGQSAAREEYSGQVAAGNPFASAAPSGVSQRLADWQRVGGAMAQQAPAAPSRTTVARAAPYQAPQINGGTYRDIGLGNTAQGGGERVGGLTRDEAAANAAKSYTGPSAIESLASWQKLGPQTQLAQDQLGATNSPEGVQALVGRQYGSSGGNGRLDAALTSGAGAQDFAALRAKYGDLVGAREQSGMAANQQSTDAARNVASLAGQYGDQVKEYDAAEQWKRDHPVQPQGPGGSFNPPPSYFTDESQALPGTRAPGPGEADVRGPETHTYAYGDPNDPSSKVAQASVAALPALASIIHPAAGAAVGAGMAANQAWADSEDANMRKEQLRRRKNRGG